MFNKVNKRWHQRVAGHKELKFSAVIHDSFIDLQRFTGTFFAHWTLWPVFLGNDKPNENFTGLN